LAGFQVIPEAQGGLKKRQHRHWKNEIGRSKAPGYRGHINSRGHRAFSGIFPS
jgi:hypothetical protein